MARNATKSLSVYFLRGHYVNRDATPIINSELWSEILDSINYLPIDIEAHRAGRASRYYVKDNTYYGVLFYDNENRTLNPEILEGNLICGIAYKRRDVNWPFLENGAGSFDRIQTNTTHDSLAEVTFFLIDKRRSVMLYVSNPRAASVNILIDYISAQWRNAYREQTLDNVEPSFINLAFIHHPDVDGEFTRMQSISKVELQLSGRDLLNSVSTNLNPAHNNDMQEVIRRSIQSSMRYGSYVMQFGFNVDLDTTDITAHNELKRSLRGFKNAVNLFFRNQILESRASNAKNKCSISGRIDDASRTLDLLEDKLLVKTHMEFSGHYLEFGEVFDKLHEIYTREDTMVALSIEETVVQ